MNIKTLSEEEARYAGYRRLTRPYRPSQEQMWLKVLIDMSQGNIDCCLVLKHTKDGQGGDYKGVTVWRK